MLANRVKKRFRHLHRRFAKQNIEVFRLYDWDIPEIRTGVDWYGDHLVVGEYMRRQSVPIQKRGILAEIKAYEIFYRRHMVDIPRIK
jgi:23S rRNA G2069 N7-methylase RlmK/C1962 C5-methylase RlmI